MEKRYFILLDHVKKMRSLLHETKITMPHNQNVAIKISQNELDVANMVCKLFVCNCDNIIFCSTSARTENHRLNAQQSQTFTQIRFAMRRNNAAPSSWFDTVLHSRKIARPKRYTNTWPLVYAGKSLMGKLIAQAVCRSRILITQL